MQQRSRLCVHLFLSGVIMLARAGGSWAQTAMGRWSAGYADRKDNHLRFLLPSTAHGARLLALMNTASPYGDALIKRIVQ